MYVYVRVCVCANINMYIHTSRHGPKQKIHLSQKKDWNWQQSRSRLSLYNTLRHIATHCNKHKIKKKIWSNLKVTKFLLKYMCVCVCACVWDSWYQSFIRASICILRICLYMSICIRTYTYIYIYMYVYIHLSVWGQKERCWSHLNGRCLFIHISTVICVHLYERKDQYAYMCIYKCVWRVCVLIRARAKRKILEQFQWKMSLSTSASNWVSSWELHIRSYVHIYVYHVHIYIYM